MLINEATLNAALTRIAETDDEAAELHADVERAEFKAKAIRDSVFLRAEGSSVAERQAQAGTHPDYKAAMRDYFAALQAYESLKNERARKFVVIDVWRSENSARTKGVLI